MSRWTTLGTVTDTNDREVTVFRHDAGDVRLIGQEDALEFEPAERDKLRELLDRAAMPGREELPRAAKCPRCGLPDGTAPVHGTAARVCQHIWHQYRPQAEVEGRADGGPPATEASHGA